LRQTEITKSAIRAVAKFDNRVEQALKMRTIQSEQVKWMKSCEEKYESEILTYEDAI
jgi:hypothetical protein